MIVSDDIALLIYAQAAVSITIVSETNIQTLLDNKPLQALNVGGACIVVDDIGICARSSQTSNQAILEHIRAAAGILANDNTSGVSIAVTLTKSVVIPAKKRPTL